MTVHKDLPGFTVNVCVDNNPLHEYDDDPVEDGPSPVDPIEKHQTERTMVKYIEAVDDKEFTIKIKPEVGTSPDYTALSFHAFVDGTCVDKPLFQKEMMKQGYPRVIIGLTNKDNHGTTTVRPLRFFKIETKDEGSYSDIMSDAAKLSKVGEIKIMVHRVHKLRVSTKSLKRNFHGDVPNEVHEKSIKGKATSHGAKVGSAQPYSTTVYTCDYLDGLDHPVAIYIFRYRSLAALKALQIIQEPVEPDRPASPLPAALSGLSEKDRQELEEYMERRMKVHVKRESDDNDRPRKRQKKPQGKVTIDLTEDDEDKQRRSGSVVLE